MKEHRGHAQRLLAKQAVNIAPTTCEAILNTHSHITRIHPTAALTSS